MGVSHIIFLHLQLYCYDSRGNYIFWHYLEMQLSLVVFLILINIIFSLLGRFLIVYQGLIFSIVQLFSFSYGILAS